MSRKLPPFVPGGYYHVYNRGAARSRIFASEENYRYLLRWLFYYAREFDVQLVAYCLMPNHYHVLVREKKGNTIPLVFQRLFNRYTKAFNKRTNRSGTLFQGPYRAIHVDRTEYLAHVIRYIHLNPVLAGLVRRPEDWQFSDYRRWVSEKPGSRPELVRQLFGGAKSYAEFVLEFLRDKRQPAQVRRYLLAENDSKNVSPTRSRRSRPRLATKKPGRKLTSDRSL